MRRTARRCLGSRGSPSDNHICDLLELALPELLEPCFDQVLRQTGNHDVRLLAILSLNAAGPGEGVAGGLIDQRFGNPNTMSMDTPFNRGNYNALQAQLKRRALGAEMGITYTDWKAFNNVDDETSTMEYSWGPAQWRNRALASYDKTHNFELYMTCRSAKARDG